LIIYPLLVERLGFAFIANVEYEWLSLFSSHCKMIGNDLSQCRVFNAHNPVVVGPQHKSSQNKKNTIDNREQGNTMGAQVVHKQPKEYRKKISIEVIDSQNMILDNSDGNLTTTVFDVS